MEARVLLGTYLDQLNKVKQAVRELDEIQERLYHSDNESIGNKIDEIIKNNPITLDMQTSNTIIKFDTITEQVKQLLYELREF